MKRMKQIKDALFMFSLKELEKSTIGIPLDPHIIN